MLSYERALRFTAVLSSVASVAEFERIVLPGLADLVPADLWGFNDLDPRSKEVVATVWPDEGFRPELAEDLARVIWEHPVIERFQQTGQGPPTRISDLWSPSRYRQSRLYREAYGPLGVEFQVAFSLADGPTAATIGFAANRSEGDFSDQELEVLALLRPALRAAWQRSQASGALAATISGEGDGEAAFVLIGADSRVRAIGVAANATIRSAGVRLDLGEVTPEPIFSWLRRRGVGRDLTVEGVRLRLVAGDRDADRVILVERAPAAGGLTAREREVVRLAGLGRTNAEIAAELAISDRTVHKHLERAYTKLGVSNRSAAAIALKQRD